MRTDEIVLSKCESETYKYVDQYLRDKLAKFQE